MRLLQILTVIGLVIVYTTTARAAVVRTTPFPGVDLIAGGALCSVTNVGTTRGTATTVLYDSAGGKAATDTFTLNPKQSGFGTFVFYFDDPVYCECTIPSTLTWRCSFTYETGTATIPMVIDAR